MTQGSAPGAVIVGTSFGLFTHLRALRAAGFEVKALVGRDAAKTRSRAARLDVPLGLTSLEEAMALDGVKVVTVATPPHTHRDIAVAVAAAGKHILCEKPFALTLKEARDMLAAVERAGVVHMIGTEFRYATTQALLRRIILDGAIGTPKYFVHLFQAPAVPGPEEHLPDWWLDAKLGGGTLGAMGVHIIDQVRSTFGDFASVNATLQTLAARPGMTADDTFNLQFELTSGLTGTIACSMATAGPPLMATRVVGSTGSAWIQGDYDKSEVWIADAAGWRPVPVPADLVNPPPVPFPVTDLIQAANDKWHAGGADLAPYTRLFEALRARIDNREPPGREPAATFRDGVAAQAIMDATRLSAAERKWVKVEGV